MSDNYAGATDHKEAPVTKWVVHEITILGLTPEEMRLDDGTLDRIFDNAMHATISLGCDASGEYCTWRCTEEQRRFPFVSSTGVAGTGSKGEYVMSLSYFFTEEITDEQMLQYAALFSGTALAASLADETMKHLTWVPALPYFVSDEEES